MSVLFEVIQILRFRRLFATHLIKLVIESGILAPFEKKCKKCAYKFCVYENIAYYCNTQYNKYT